MPPKRKPEPPRLTPAALRQKDAASYLGVSLSHFKKLRNAVFPVDVAEPGAESPVLRWRISDLDAFLAKRTLDPTATP
jgi:hypothetical protein